MGLRVAGSGARRGRVAAAVILLAAAPGACRRFSSGGRVRLDHPDVVLVTIDTLRADAPAFAGNHDVRTPNLDRLASEGVVFEQAHGHNVVTLPSHVNILTGLYPFQHGVRDNDGFRLDPSVPTLATFLKRAGYATGAFIGAFPLDARFGLSHDFDVYDQHYPEEVGPYDFVMAERPASEVIASARRWWAGTSSPRFLWVHLYDCHAPYRPPPPFDREYASNPYLGEVAGVDAALGPLFDDARADRRSILLVLTGDHGEALGEHGELTHGLFAYEATLHVPLVLWSPGALAPRRDRGLARHIDIVPTVLSSAGLPVPPSLPGRLLLSPAPAGETSYFEALSANLNRGWAPLRGELDGRNKYIDLPIPELYDLASDPAESRNVFDPGSSPVRRLRNALPPDIGRMSTQSTSSEQRAKLLSLGYLSGGAAPKSRYGPEDDPKRLVDIDRAIHDLVDLYQHGRTAEAVARAKRVVAERPGMRTGYEFLSFLQGQAGDDAGAIETLSQADRRGLLDESLRARWGLLLAESGKAEAALKVLAPLSGTRDPEILNDIGIGLATAGRAEEALRTFEKVLQLDPKNAVAYQNMGITHLQNGQVDRALAAFHAALALNDRLPRAWNSEGVALEQSGRPREAIEAWKKAVAVDPNQFDALFNIGLTARAIGDDGESRAALEDFVKRAPAAHYGPDLARARAALAGGRSAG